MRLIIHDLEDVSKLKTTEDDKVINATKSKAPCIGCFGCWIKTPGKCVLKDKIKNMGKDLASCSEVLIVSKSLYGGFSTEVKNVVDRSISFLLPFFRNIDKEQHHKPRYKQNFKLNVVIYNAEDLIEDEKTLLEKYIKAVSINMNSNALDIMYFNNEKELSL